MARHNELGKIGEEKAALYLQQSGYVVLERNWRLGRLELDLVCCKDGVLVVVEVKTRRNGTERLEELLDYSKRCHLRRAADAYIKARKLQCEVRFDLILLTGENLMLEHIKEAVQIFE